MSSLLKLIICLIILSIFITNAFALTDEADALYKSISGISIDDAAYPDVDSQYMLRLSPPVKLPRVIINGPEANTLSIYDRCFAKDEMKWHVTAVFNRSDNPANVRMNLDRIWDNNGKTSKKLKSKSTENKYLLYDVINKQILGRCDGFADIDVKPQSARLISTQIDTGYPLILSIGDKIGQGFFELIDFRWEKTISMITATTKGINNRNTSIRLYIPHGWKIRSTAINEKSGSWEEYNPEMIRFDVPDASGEITWRAAFDGSVYKKPKSRPVNSSAIAMLRPVISK